MMEAGRRFVYLLLSFKLYKCLSHEHGVGGRYSAFLFSTYRIASCRVVLSGGCGNAIMTQQSDALTKSPSQSPSG